MDPYYKDSRVAIYHADALDLMAGFDGIGAIVTDPPYSSGGQFRGDRAQATSAKYVQTGTKAYRPEFGGDNRDQRAYLVWSTLWLGAARSACLPGAPCCVFSDWRQLATTTDAIQCGGWIFRNLATWWKPGVRMQKCRFSSSAEYIVYGTNGPAAAGVGSVQNVFSQPIDANKDRIHIAEKPLAVMNWILNVVPEGATILDPFMGSGTTLRAAIDSGFRAIGIDHDEANCEIAAKRCQQQTIFKAKAEAEAGRQATLFDQAVTNANP